MKIDGKQIAENLQKDLRGRVEELHKKDIIPQLVVILVGENPASVAYVLGKQKKGQTINAKVTVLRYEESVTTEELAKKITELNQDPKVHAILIQRPLPDHIDVNALELLTDPEKDIDGFHPDSPYTLPLPLAVVHILEEIFRMNKQKDESFKDWLNAQHIVVIGKGNTGGKPVIEYFNTLGVEPVVVDSKTQKPEEIIKKADIVVSAVGRSNMVNPDMLKKGVILISVGLFKGEDGKLHGDYEEEQIKDIASYYTPTPGGVGPVNVAMLLENLVTAAEKSK